MTDAFPLRFFQTGPSDLSSRPKDKTLADALRTFCADNQIRYDYYDDEAMESFVETECPEWHPTFLQLESMVEKADFWRYLIVHRYGGFYSDLDCEIRPGLKRALERRDRPIVQIERDDWCTYTASTCQLPEFGQFFFGFPQGSEILLDVIRLVDHRIRTRPFAHLSELQQILHHTGPGAFGTVMLRHRKEIRLFRRNSLVHHRCFGSWLGDRSWGKKFLLIRRRFISYEDV